MLTDNINVALDYLYDRLIGRNFIESKEYKEQLMVQQLTSKLPPSIRYTQKNLKVGIFDHFSMSRKLGRLRPW